MLCNRLKKKYKHLKKWASRTDTEAFRLYDRDIPEIPLLIDLYKDAVSGALFERPYEKDEHEEEAWLAAMEEAMSEAIDIPLERIFIKIRKKQRGESQYGRFETRNFFVDIRENELTFRTNLSDYLDTGLFLDRRKLRRLVKNEAAGKSVLNLFCYTATFSLCAAAGGAARTDSVDISNTYLDWAKVNFSLNGFNASPRPPNPARFRLIRQDALTFLDDAVRQRLSWDIIILDPPTFSNSKKMRGDFDINRDHETVIEKSLKLLKDTGKLYFSTNARRFHLSDHLIESCEEKGFSYKNITEQLRDEDFSSKKIPDCWIFFK